MLTEPSTLGEMTQSLFAIDCSHRPFIGVDSGKRWNGWAVPLFPMAVCQAIAAEFLRDDGSPIFRFNPDSQMWEEHTEEGWITWEPSHLIEGVPHWVMGDGYMWDKVSCGDDDDGWGWYYVNGAQTLPSAIPLDAQCAILWAIWKGGSGGSITHQGSTYSWDL